MTRFKNTRAIKQLARPCAFVAGRLPAAVLLLAGLLLLAACGRDSQTWQRIERQGILRVGLDPTYPPFEDAGDGTLRGLDVDLAHALAAELGLEVAFTYFGYDGLYDALATQQVDVLISALVVAPERTKDFAFSDSYYNAGQILITAATDASTQEMGDLNGRSLAVELGSEGHVIATTWQRRLPNLTILTHNSPDEALTAVADGEATAVLVDSISGRLFLRNTPGLRQVENPVTVEPYALVVRIDDRTLLKKLNESLARLKTSGQLLRIIDHWLG